MIYWKEKRIEYAPYRKLGWGLAVKPAGGGPPLDIL